MKSRLEPCVQQSPREEHLGYCPRGIPGLPMELWPGSTMDSYQIVALRCILEHAYQRNQFYRNKCEQVGIGPEQLRKISDLARFPFTTKSELCGAPWKLLAVNKDDVCQIHMSTGTTSERIGDHLYSVLTWDDIFFNEVANRFGFMMPSRPGDVVVVALPYEMSSAGFSMHRAYQHSAECIVVNVGKGGFYSDPRKTALIMKDLNARILCTTASYALQLWESALSCGVDPSRDLDLNGATGEN